MQQTDSDDASPKLLRRTVLKSTAAGAAIATVGGRVAADEGDEGDEEDEEETDEEQVEVNEDFAAIIFPTQVTDGSTVEIEWVRLPEGGFVSLVDPVAAHEELWPIQGETMPHLDELVATQVRGATEFLDAGEHEDVVLEPDEPLEGEKLYQVWVHQDTTGDETFDYVESVGEEDGPYAMEFESDEEDEGAEGDGETIPPDTAIEFSGQIGGWVGLAPDDLADETNPTLTLQAGESYEIGWTEGDGAGHNIAIRDEDGEVVDDLVTDVTTDPDDDQWLEFEASAEMAEYVCEPHSGTMVGDIAVQEEDAEGEGEDAEDEEGDESAEVDEEEEEAEEAEEGEEEVAEEDEAEDDPEDEEDREEAAGPGDPEDEESAEEESEIHPTQVPNIVMGDAYLHRLEDVPEDEMPDGAEPEAEASEDEAGEEEVAEEDEAEDDPEDEEDREGAAGPGDPEDGAAADEEEENKTE